MKHIALDFDRTLHDYDSKKGLWVLNGPLKPMVETVKKYLNKGYKFTIFTARVSHDLETNIKQEIMIKNWLIEQGLPEFDVTATKYNYFDEFWDDKAISVVKNVGTFRFLNNNPDYQ